MTDEFLKLPFFDLIVIQYLISLLSKFLFTHLLVADLAWGEDQIFIAGFSKESNIAILILRLYRIRFQDQVFICYIAREPYTLDFNISIAQSSLVWLQINLINQVLRLIRFWGLLELFYNQVWILWGVISSRKSDSARVLLCLLEF